MPQVKFDCIVSFSDEDPENPASNLLSMEVSKKKWLCKPGERSCSVVLGLPCAVRISSVQVCAYDAALVEVLVARSETSADSYKVLVNSSVLLSPAESRRGAGRTRVRSFPSAELAADARSERWDRVRVVCSQPYNKHCQYGLCFIHVFSEEESQTSRLPARLFNLDMCSSDEDSFKPGELFAKLKSPTSNTTVTEAAKNTDAQIRQATSNALKHISHDTTQLVKTPINRDKTKQSTIDKSDKTDAPVRQRAKLIYTDDDEQPHSKIDKVVEKRNEEKKLEQSREQEQKKKKQMKATENRETDKKTNPSKTSDSNFNSKKAKVLSDNSKKNDIKMKIDDSGKNLNRGRHKRSRSQDPAPKKVPPHRVLEGVVLVLSGYQNPQRSRLRDLALAMGAQCRSHWGPDCTHLICAFPNTPKLREVRAAARGAGRGGQGGQAGEEPAVALGDWLQRCSSWRRLVPWQWFATEPQLRRPEEALPPLLDSGPDTSDCDTDDEIEKVLQQSKKRATMASPEPKVKPVVNTSTDSDVSFVRDERIKGHVTLDSSSDEDTEEELQNNDNVKIDPRSKLPDFLDGCTVALEEKELREAGFDLNEIRRYVRAYGGELVQEESKASVMLCCDVEAKGGGAARRVRADLLWEEGDWPHR